MLSKLPRFSLETLVLLRLYGPRPYALCQEDEKTVEILTDPSSSEDGLLQSLRTAHHMHLFSARENFRHSVLRGASIFQVGPLFRCGIYKKLRAHVVKQTFYAPQHGDIVTQAYKTAMDPLQPMPSLDLLGPSMFERTVVEIAGNPRMTNKVQITDHSIEKLTATLEGMGVKDWKGRLSTVEALHSKAEILARNIREWQV